MKLILITGNLTSKNYSGGSVHVNNVARILKKYFHVTVIPSLSWFVKPDFKELKELEKEGFEVPSEVFAFNKNIHPSFLPYSEKTYYDYLSLFHDLDGFIYDPDYNFSDAIFFSNKFSLPLGITAHIPLYSLKESFIYTYYSLKPILFKTDSLSYLIKRTVGLSLQTSKKVKDLKRAKNLKFIAAVSEGVLTSIKREKIDSKLILLDPANGVDSSLLKYRSKEKEDYIVYWTTLIPSKGIFNLLDIIKILKDKYHLNLNVKISGKFLYENFKKDFFDYIRRNNLNVEYLGFLPKDELYKVISKAKLLIYPSLADGFPLVILEAITVGTPVIAYDFYPIFSAYRNVPAVRFSPLDNKKFAEIVYNSLRDGFLDSVYDERTLKFIEKHNWNSVGENIAKIIKEFS